MSDFAWFLMVPISAIIGHYAAEIVRAIYGRERKEDDNKEENKNNKRKNLVEESK